MSKSYDNTIPLFAPRADMKKLIASIVTDSRAPGEAKQVEVVILNQGEDASFEEDLAKDVLEIITVFSARLYGSRSHKNKRMLERIEDAVQQKD